MYFFMMLWDIGCLFLDICPKCRKRLHYNIVCIDCEAKNGGE